eukprot:m.265881 g.265881  ORF g.265881 m.265881 type:complete len:429 (-) comp64257_c0_seq1:38-1324(-)
METPNKLDVQVDEIFSTPPKEAHVQSWFSKWWSRSVDHKTSEVTKTPSPCKQRRSFDFINDDPTENKASVLDQEWDHMSCANKCCYKIHHRERLSLKSIIINVLYNIMLFTTILLTLSSLVLHDWVQSNQEQMNLAGIFVEQSIPGFESVGCGLRTYCIQAADSTECSIPIQTYGKGIFDAPVELWPISSGFIFTGTILITVPWLYTFFACFGCFHSRIQFWMNKMTLVAGVAIVGGIVTFAVSFADLGVRKCKTPHANATATSVPPCLEWYATLPSDVLEGPGNAACRFCAPAVAPFVISDSCKFGWGAIFAVGSVVMIFVTSPLGRRVTPRQKKLPIDPLCESSEHTPTKGEDFNDVSDTCSSPPSYQEQTPAYAEEDYASSTKKLTHRRRGGSLSPPRVSTMVPPTPPPVKVLLDGVDHLEQSTM